MTVSSFLFALLLWGKDVPNQQDVQVVKPPAKANPFSANDSFSKAAKDMALLAGQDLRYTRWLEYAPYDEADRPDLEAVLQFWLGGHLNNSTSIPPLVRTADGQYRIDLRQYRIPPEAWERLCLLDPYYAVTQVDASTTHEGNGGALRRGWVDPLIEAQVRQATYSTQAVLRLDFFLAKTSLERGEDNKFLNGVYSDFKGLKTTADAFYKDLGSDDKFIEDNYLRKGGAVLQSIVALHNRGLQFRPTLVGLTQRYAWESLDFKTDHGKNGENNVLEKDRTAGRVKVAGREIIASGRNGFPIYFIVNDKAAQVPFVPQDIAQDRGNPHDVTVRGPVSCVRCHGPSGGIIQFSDVIRKIRTDLDAGTRRVLITKGPPGADLTEAQKLADLLEEYYASDLGVLIGEHQREYKAVVLQTTGRKPEDISALYVKTVHDYLYAQVDKPRLALETGIPEAKLREALKAMGTLEEGASTLVILEGKNAISREKLEAAYPVLMKAQAYKWETKIVIPSALNAKKDEPKKPEPQTSKERKPDEPFKIPEGGERMEVEAGFPQGTIRFNKGGKYYAWIPGRGLTVHNGSDWIPSTDF